MTILLKVKFYYEIGETVRFSCSNGQQLSGEQKHNLPLHYGNLGGQNWIIYLKDIEGNLMTVARQGGRIIWSVQFI